MSRTAAVRTLLILSVLTIFAGLGVIDARGETTPPTIELLEPAAGAKVVISREQGKYATYRFRVNFPADYAGVRVVALEDARDAAFTVDRGLNTMLCAAAVTVCDLSYTPRTSFAPGTRVYWRVKIPDTVVSSSRSFVTTGVTVADRDRDGIADGKDNCPSVRNPKQTDFEYDGKGDACQPDTRTPRVKAYSGSARRGQFAQFDWKAVDNRPVTIRLVLRWRGRVVMSGWMPNVAARIWGPPGTASQWESRQPIGSRFPIGSYTYCISAQDAAGHKATSCAPYYIRA